MNYYENQVAGGAAPAGHMNGQSPQGQWNGLPPGMVPHHPAMNGGGPAYFVPQHMHQAHLQHAMAGDVPDWTCQPQANQNAERHLFEAPNSGINFDNYENIPVEVSGNDVPAAIDKFSEADLHEWIQNNIALAGYTKPTPVQKNSLPTLLSRRDLMSCAQTGSGKTAAFLVPIINSILVDGPSAMMQSTINGQGRKTDFPAALVLSPTRELAMQIKKEADKFSYRTNIKTAILYGGRENYRDQINMLKAGVHILVATPGRLIDVVQQGHIGLQGIKYLVLDEADRMLDMGFEPQIRKVVALGVPNKDVRTTAMFSATFPKEIQVLAQDFLKQDYVFLAVGRVGSTSENIEQRLQWVEEHDKKRALCSILEMTEATALVLVFVETKRGANELAWFLHRNQVRAVAIHGDLKQFERERNLESFRTNKLNVLVATAVAARGLDIPNVRHVVNFDLPNDVDEYVHRIGRTGRCGNNGVATSFFNDKNRPIARDLNTLLAEANQEVPEFIRRCAAEGGGGRGSRGRFGGTDHRRGGRGGSFGGPRGGGMTMFAPQQGYGQQRQFGATEHFSSGGFNGGSNFSAPSRGGYQTSGYAGFGQQGPPSFGNGGGFHQGGSNGGMNGRGGMGQQQPHMQSGFPNAGMQQQYGGFAQNNFNPGPPQNSFGTWGQ